MRCILTFMEQEKDNGKTCVSCTTMCIYYSCISRGRTTITSNVEMKTEAQIRERIKYVEDILEDKRANGHWDDYEYYQEELYTLDWVLND